MALGGGTFTAQNKPLPGTYINFVSVKAAGNSLSGRGVATMPLFLDWGPEGVFKVTQDEFLKNSRQIFGYDYTSEKLKNLRELFLHITTLYGYNLQGGGGKATSDNATARYSGLRGNDLKYVIAINPDNTSMFDVTLYLGTVKVDMQTVAKAEELKDNDYVTWKTGVALEETAGKTLAGGTNAEVTGDSYQAYLDAIESYSFNVMGIAATDETTKKMVASFTKRMRDDVGVKFQTVMYHYEGDYEGIINVENKVKDDGAEEASLVYWVTGAEAGCAVEDSLMNSLYNGEYTVDVAYTQSGLKAALDAGKLIFHNVAGDVRVLRDINSLVTLADDKGEIFQDNKTVRVCDQIGNDIAALFNMKYMGKIPNDDAGRVSLWNDVVDLHNSLERLRAIENFSSENISVAQGESKNAVVITDAITVTGTMEQLYMTVRVA